MLDVSVLPYAPLPGASIWLDLCSPMEASVLSALAALGGASIGGLTSGVISWINQELQVKAQESAQDKSFREELDREFIEEASKAYVYALQNNNDDVPAMVAALRRKSAECASCARLGVIEQADQVMKLIVDAYLAPNKVFRSYESR